MEVFKPFLSSLVTFKEPNESSRNLMSKVYSQFDVHLSNRVEFSSKNRLNPFVLG